MEKIFLSVEFNNRSEFVPINLSNEEQFKFEDLIKSSKFIRNVLKPIHNS